MERATEIANDLVKADPSNVNGHKLLARIYSRQAGDPEQGRVDQNMLKQALAEYQQVVKLIPKTPKACPCWPACIVLPAMKLMRKRPTGPFSLPIPTTAMLLPVLQPSPLIVAISPAPSKC